MRDILRFFSIVRPWHPVIGAGLAVMAVASGALVAAGCVHAVDALAPIVLLQALAASSGFAAPARAGHYDFLIASGHKRLWVGVAHWATSVTPGIAGWLLIALIEFTSTGGATPASLTVGTATALFLVSTLPWAATAPLPRLTGGLIWIVLLAAVVTMMPVSPITEGARIEGDSLPVRLMAVLACPWVLARDGVIDALIAPAAVAMAIAVGGMAAALVWIHRADIPLERAQ